ncbi:DUF2332 domain-containing protein [Aureimonas leprariae]|uniref:DUF2332 domain-containing protein n=1 Tax=Plantimonas leprariae TaxID=2615207 RepID=A0A7V7PNP4_9HYPH|nr:DUF2332 domain-containing protein [Aureimonas leprariae]KAB0679402.1 DUF2332 domain-containing protein [Aureimonas leprariae]
MTIDPDQSELASRYRRFAFQEASGRSPLYEHLAAKAAEDAAIIALIADLPQPKQQPNLLFAAYRHILGVPSDYSEFRRGLTDRFDAVRSIMLERSTQTNEPGRCAVLLPVLASLPQPLALLEVGASAGLCLFPDRYGYDYSSKSLRPPKGAKPYPVFPCRAAASVPVPDTLPQIVWRAGLDLNPLDAGDPDAAAWLETLVWPDQEERRNRLRLALGIVAEEQPTLVQGDLLGPEFEALCRQAPQDATLVVFHTAVLAYVPSTADRMTFADRVSASSDVWICNEDPSVMSQFSFTAVEAPSQGAFLMSVNGQPTAWTDPHGAWIEAIADVETSVLSSAGGRL